MPYSLHFCSMCSVLAGAAHRAVLGGNPPNPCLAGRMHVDDASGQRRTFADLAQDAAHAHKQLQARLEAPWAATSAAGSGPAALAQHPVVAGMAGSGLGGASGGGLLEAEPPRPSPRLRMSGVYLGCLENRGGYFPIRDTASKW